MIFKIFLDNGNSSFCGMIDVNTDGFSVEDQTYTVYCEGNFVTRVVELRRKYVDDNSRFFNIVEVTVYGTNLGELDIG